MPQSVTKAMILAAGLGTRLRPLTNDRPKALVTINGRTLLEIAIVRLRSFGVGEIIVNTHHFADQISNYLTANQNFGMRIEISHEDTLLDTGGGLKHASWFFLDGKDPHDPSLGASIAPFILHNVDVISTIDLARTAVFHQEHAALATLAVQTRESSRHLLFDQQGHLCGRRIGRYEAPQLVRPAQSTQTLAFSGIHVISPRIFGLLTETGAFSIIDAYLRLASQGETIAAFRADDYRWRDLGTHESIAAAAREIE
jgi:NDP-sugar pyrophosphorylase family protein